MKRDPLSTARFGLEPLTEAHATSLYEPLSAPEIYRFIARTPPRNVAALITRYRQLETGSPTDDSETWLNWAIYFPSEKRFVGKVQATVHPHRRAASLAYLLSPSHWGMGCATEVCRTVMEHLIADWAVETIEAVTDTRNERSIRLLERLSFTRTETRRSEDIIGGEPSIEHVYRFQKCRAPDPNPHP